MKSQQSLNPFAFPAETRVRFRLLIITAIALTFNLGFFLALQFGMPSLLELYPRIQMMGLPPAPETRFFPGGMQLRIDYRDNLLGLTGQILRILAFPAGLTLVTLGAALVLYRTHPIRNRAKPPMKSGSTGLDYQIRKEIHDLATRYTVTPPFRIETQGRLNRTTGARVFGLRNHYILQMGGNLRLAFVKNRKIFNATILHELAHIANHDVLRTYFSSALWLALVFFAVLPIIGFVTLNLPQMVVAGMWRELLLIYGQILGTLAVVYAIWASLLRVREFYADARVALWGMARPLRTMIESNIATRTTRQPKLASPQLQAIRHQVWQLFRWPWLFHPQLLARLDALNNPARLFRLAPEVAFFVGFLIALLYGSLVFLTLTIRILVLTIAEIGLVNVVLSSPTDDGLLVRGTQASLPFFTIAAYLVVLALILGSGYLITETVGLEAQRAAVAATFTSAVGLKAYIGLLLPASLLAFGIQSGQLIMPYNPVIIETELLHESGQPAAILTSLSIQIITFWLWFIYIYFSAGWIYSSAAGDTIPHGRRHWFNLILSLLVCLLLAPTLLTHEVIALMTGITITVSRIAMFRWVLLLYALLFGGTWMVMYIAGRARLPYDTPRPIPSWLFRIQSEQEKEIFMKKLSSSSMQSVKPLSPHYRIVAGSIILLTTVLLTFGVTMRSCQSPPPVAGPDDTLLQPTPTSMAAPGVEVEATYAVTGANVQEDTYEGTLAVTKSGLTYQLTWETNVGDFIGTGLLRERILAATYGPEYCKVVAYEVLENGTLDGAYTQMGWTVRGREVAVPETGTTPNGIAGSYRVTAPELADIAGDVAPEIATEIAAGGDLVIRPSGTTYQLVWETQREGITGTGILRDSILAAVFGGPGECGLVVYEVQSDGSLEGVWTEQGATQVGTEEAIPIE
jgi:hypothetical protein